jgi:uncharacterized protein DUF4394
MPPVRVLAVLVLSLLARIAAATMLVALGEDGTLAVFPSDRPADVRVVRVSGVSGRLVGIDVRPADGRVYGLAGTSDLYRLEVERGTATLVASLTVPFDGGARSGVDFNPQSDRLRLVSGEGQNVRVHPTLGAAAVDRPVAWKPGDPHAGGRPRIAAAAYTHNVANAPTTRLLVIDAEADVLAAQDPPNDGILATIGPLGVDVGPLAGFDVVTDPEGRDHGFLAAGRALYAVDVDSGRCTPLGTIGGEGPGVVGLTVLP